MTLFSIIIPTHNRPRQLRACLDSLVSLNYATELLEVLVVDDGSPQAITEELDSFRERLNLKEFRQHQAGPAAARNTGAAGAKGKFLVFIDDDCCVSSDWLRHFEAAFRQTPESLLAGRIVNAFADNRFVAISELILKVLLDNFYPEPGGIYFVRSANLAVPAEAFAALKGFNPSFRTAEDREFCDRWLYSGRMIRAIAGAEVSHASVLSLAGYWWQHFRYGRGAYRFHKLRHMRGSGGFRFEFLQFYIKVFMAPLIPFTRYSLVTLVLLLIWQLANSCGFVFELVLNHLAKRHFKSILTEWDPG